MKKYLLALIILTFSFISLAPAVSVWADASDASDPSTERDIRGYITNTSWYDPNDGSCAVDGISISGESKFLTGDPLTLKFPTISDEAAFARAMVTFIRRASPNSPWLGIRDLGTRLVEETKTRNINPMMILVIARQESQIGTSPVAQRNNNSFGNKGNGPGGYRAWPSFEASLFGNDSFTKAVEDRLEGRHPSYAKVTNMYEYLSVHVSGQIIYPGDTTKVHDEIMDEDVTSEGVVNYFKHATDWIGDITGLDISGIPSKGDSGPGCGGGGSGGCLVTVDGIKYAFPLAPCTKRNYTDMPCNNSPRRYSHYYGTETIVTCHHDGSPAFDLYYGEKTTGGAAVYAITDGRIINSQNYYHGVEGCYSIQFYSTVGNRYYWYGHLQKSSVKGGQRNIKAGQKIAEVGNQALKERGCSPGPPHLHIDRGCVNTRGTERISDDDAEYGGDDPCRDPKFLKDLRKVWEALPNAS
jgi:hypothetical protein